MEACQDCIDYYECEHALEEAGILFCDKDPLQFCPREDEDEYWWIDSKIDDLILEGR